MLIHPNTAVIAWPLAPTHSLPAPAVSRDAGESALADVAVWESNSRIEAETADSEAEKLDSFRIKIIVSDDDALSQMSLITLLADYLMLGKEHFLPAFNLKSALAVFEREQIDIRAVLTDIDMPEPYAGLRLHKELRQYFGFTGPIALMSARGEDDPTISTVVDEDPETQFFPKPIMDIAPIGDWLRRGWS